MDNHLSQIKNNISKWAPLFPVVLIVFGVLVLGKIFLPLIKEEIRYQFSEEKEKVIVTEFSSAENNSPRKKIEKIVPVDMDFSLVIPKISANTKVVSDVDANDPAKYQRALTEGVAHAAGTAYPDEEGNVFIFAHSGVDFAQALRYNAVFYLLGKMKAGDSASIFYKGKEISYTVKERKIVNADEIQYLKGDGKEKTLTLMTCWPAGTTFRRLVIIAQQN